MVALIRRNLADLLAARPIAHPTSIERITQQDRHIEIDVAGHAWWQENPGARTGRILLRFERVSEGFLPALIDPDDNEALEDFHLRPLADLGWAQQAGHALYCQGPLPDPAALYVRLERALESWDSFRRPGDFLNQGESLARFVALASRDSFLLARAPGMVVGLLRTELDRQAAQYNVVGQDDRREDRLWVRLGSASFLCAEAWAAFEA